MIGVSIRNTFSGTGTGHVLVRKRGKTMAKAAGKPRKKLPKELAVIRADNCTGCDACIEVCPVD